MAVLFFGFAQIKKLHAFLLFPWVGQMFSADLCSLFIFLYIYGHVHFKSYNSELFVTFLTFLFYIAITFS